MGVLLRRGEGNHMNGIDYKKSLAQKEKNKEAGLKFCLLPKIQTKQFFFLDLAISSGWPSSLGLVLALTNVVNCSPRQCLWGYDMASSRNELFLSLEINCISILSFSFFNQIALADYPYLPKMIAMKLCGSWI